MSRWVSGTRAWKSSKPAVELSSALRSSLGVKCDPIPSTKIICAGTFDLVEYCSEHGTPVVPVASCHLQFPEEKQGPAFMFTMLLHLYRRVSSLGTPNALYSTYSTKVWFLRRKPRPQIANQPIRLCAVGPQCEFCPSAWPVDSRSGHPSASALLYFGIDVSAADLKRGLLLVNP